MPSKYVHTEIEGRKLKLSNLDKIIYPELQVSKAEIIQYYLSVAPLILKYIKGRPLTLIRYPDGIGKTQFYAKSKPKWTPEWIDSYGIQHSEETINYVVAQDSATVVWLANLAALELHPMQMTTDTFEHPDHFIFDLDPPENGDFEVVKQIALSLKRFLESYDYAPFVKTSGSKGLHIFVPIIKEYSHEDMVDSVKALAKVFVSQNKETSTLALNKGKREGKTLIDIFRNHMAHTTVAPYSLRGKAGAPISFPITWEVLTELTSAKDIHIRNYQSYLDKYGDVWDNYGAQAKPLHNRSKQEVAIAPEIEAKLKDYIAKRDFNTTPEPGLAPVPSKGNQFCIQLHDAQNLHYDLRLEKDGTLLSWAIPKGLPTKKGQKRLAIQTEDHPMKYLTFEGVIPKGQYGAGKMWVWTRGEFDWIEKGEKKHKVKLKSPGFNRSFSMFKTRDNQWLVELIADDDNNHLTLPLKPMLAGVTKKIPTISKYIYEIKWDGIRTIIHLQDDKVTIYSRSGRDLSQQFPELLDPDSFEVESGIFDGEIVNLDEQGRPLFSNIISRMHTKGATSIELVKKKYPAVCYLFDCLSLDGKTIIKEPLSRRQAWLNTVIKKGTSYKMSEGISDGKGLWEATKQMDLEGIMAKDSTAQYFMNQRSDAWLKIKHRTTESCYIAGYTKGEGDRSHLFGALHLLKPSEDGKMVYMGKVGTGFDSDKMKYLLSKFESLKVDIKPFKEKTDDDRTSVWLKPELLCDIQFASLASSGVYREPVFQGLKEDTL